MSLWEKLAIAIWYVLAIVGWGWFSLWLGGKSHDRSDAIPVFFIAAPLLGRLGQALIQTLWIWLPLRFHHSSRGPSRSR